MLKDIKKEDIENLISLKLSGHEIADKLNISRKTLYNKMNLFGLKLNTTEPYFDINIFDNIDTEEKAYWLGFLYSDGYVCGYNNTIEISLKALDINQLFKFKNFLKDTRNDDDVIKISSVVTNGKTFKRCRYIVCNKYFHDSLINLGCVPKKSLILSFPDLKIFNNDTNLTFSFIRGYIDGDGSLSKDYHSGRLRIDVCGTENFLLGIRNIFNCFSYPRKDKRKNVYSINCSFNNADKIAMCLYEKATIYLDRKFEKFATLCRLYNTSEKSSNIGEGCDANTEITSEITKGPEES